MNQKVKSFIKEEIRELVSISDFDKVFYLFEQLLEYDIGVPENEGVGEILTLNLNRIACEKIDREDAISMFPILWGKFESFVRVLLFIVDKEAFCTLKNNDSLPNILDLLGIKLFVKNKKERTNETEVVYNTYNYRNLDAHKCRKYSMRDLYRMLDDALASYVVIIDKKYETIMSALQLAYEGVGFEDSSDFEWLTIPSRDLFDYEYDTFFNLREVSHCFTNIRHHSSHSSREKVFNHRGLLFRERYRDKSSETITRSKYEERDGLVFKQRKQSITTINGKQSERIVYREYKYDVDDRLNAINQYDENGIMTSKLEIVYKSNGEIDIVSTSFRRATIEGGKGNNYKKGDIKTRRIRSYDRRGNLKSIKNKEGREIAEYIYNNEKLIGFKDALGERRVEFLADYIIVKLKNEATGEFQIVEKRKLEEGLTSRIYKENMLETEYYRKNGTL